MARSKAVSTSVAERLPEDLPPASPNFRPLASRSTSGSWLVTFARRDSNRPKYWLKARKAVQTIPPSRRKAEQLSAEIEFRTAVAVRDYFANFAEFANSLPRPVLFLKEFDAILSEYRSGRHLKNDLFWKGNLAAAAIHPEALRGVVAASGRWLKLLHQMTPPDWLPVHPLDLAEVRRRTDAAAAALAPEVAQHVPLRTLADWISDLGNGAQRMAVSHGDFQPGNILISGSGISVIDLGTAGVRPPEDDLAFLVTFAFTHKERVAFGNAAGTRLFLRNVCDAFLEGYGLGAAEGRAAMRPYVAWLIVQRLADMTGRIRRFPSPLRRGLEQRLVGWVRSELPLFLKEFD